MIFFIWTNIVKCHSIVQVSCRCWKSFCPDRACCQNKSLISFIVALQPFYNVDLWGITLERNFKLIRTLTKRISFYIRAVMLVHEWMTTGKSTVAFLCIDLCFFLNNFFITQGNKRAGEENLRRISGFPEIKYAKFCISQKALLSRAWCPDLLPIKV